MKTKFLLGVVVLAVLAVFGVFVGGDKVKGVEKDAVTTVASTSQQVQGPSTALVTTARNDELRTNQVAPSAALFSSDAAVITDRSDATFPTTLALPRGAPVNAAMMIQDTNYSSNTSAPANFGGAGSGSFYQIGSYDTPDAIVGSTISLVATSKDALLGVVGNMYLSFTPALPPVGAQSYATVALVLLLAAVIVLDPRRLTNTLVSSSSGHLRIT